MLPLFFGAFATVIKFLERMGMDVSPQQRIEDMIRVTEFCIDLLRENEEHHGDVCFLFYLKICFFFPNYFSFCFIAFVQIF